MRAIILAAGRGSRLNGHVHDGPKALLRVGSASLIQRQIRALREAGIADVTVVVGCEADRVREHCGPGITYVENGEFATTNSLYSLWMARALLFEGCVVLNCDVLFHPQLLSDLLTARHDAALMLAYRRPDEPPFGDEEMKVKVRGGRVVDMSKAMEPAEADGENVGMLRFDAGAVPVLVEKLDAIVAAGGPPRLGAAGVRGLRERAAALRDRDARLSLDRDRLPGGLRARRARHPPAHRRCQRRNRRSAAPARSGRRGRALTMYERFYGLRERPFALSPDPDYLYPSRVHREALELPALRHRGPRRVRRHHRRDRLRQDHAAADDAARAGPRDHRGAAREHDARAARAARGDPDRLRSRARAGRKPAMLRQLGEFLVGERAAGRLVLLVIDEAQNLSLPALEEVRMLSNLETEKSKLIQIVLVGQPDLREKLGRPELEQLRQRVTVSYHLGPLDPEDTARYINHRLRARPIGAPLEFPADVSRWSTHRSGGVPRLINVICDAMLLFGYGEDRRTIDMALADEALAELEATGVLSPATERGAARRSGVRRNRAAGRPAGTDGPSRIRSRGHAGRARRRSGHRCRAGGCASRARGTSVSAARRNSPNSSACSPNRRVCCATRAVEVTERHAGGHAARAAGRRPRQRPPPSARQHQAAGAMPTRSAGSRPRRSPPPALGAAPRFLAPRAPRARSATRLSLDERS